MRHGISIVAALALLGSIAGSGVAAAPVLAHDPPSITVWDGYSGSGGAEAAAMAAVVARVQAHHPGITISVEDHGYPGVVFDFFDPALNRTVDVMVAPNDYLFWEWDSGLIRDVSSAVAPRLRTMRPQAIAGSTVDQRLVQVPESLKAIALYYDSRALRKVPRTTGQWLAALRAGTKLGVVGSGGGEPYYAYGFYGAFGGKILNGSGRCVADRTPGVSDALAWLRDATAAGLTWFPDSASALQALATGEVAGYLDGNWMLGNVEAAVGHRLAVAAGPSGPAGPFRSLVGVDGYVVNAASPNADAALKVALALTDRSAQATFMRIAGHVPADRTIDITDTRVAAFAEATKDGVLRPVGPYLDAYWGPFGDAINGVMYGGADPASAVGTACSAMNEANGF